MYDHFYYQQRLWEPPIKSSFQSSFFSLSSHHMNHQSSPAAVKSTNSLAILVLLQGSSHESHCTILLPHLQVDDKGATDEEDAQELMLFFFWCWLVLMIMCFFTNWMLCPKCPPPPLESMIGWVESMLKPSLFVEINNNVNNKVGRLIERTDNKVDIFVQQQQN